MANNVYYWLGTRDKLAMRLPKWEEDWTPQDCADYDAGYNS